MLINCTYANFFPQTLLAGALTRYLVTIRAQLNSAPGYAVFSNVNVNVILFAAGTGYGLVKDNSSGKYTYMNMAEGGLGFGAGAKDYRIVMLFHTREAMRQFVESGWTFGGNADAALKANDKD